jgi:hypothetical protein
MQVEQLLDNFQNALNDNGDDFISCGDTVRDVMAIKSLLSVQGYWAGDSIRYYFNEDLTLLRTEERVFGI